MHWDSRTCPLHPPSRDLKSSINPPIARGQILHSPLGSHSNGENKDEVTFKGCRNTGVALLYSVGDPGRLFRCFLNGRSVAASIFSPRLEQELLPAFWSPPEATASDRWKLHMCEGFCSLGMASQMNAPKSGQNTVNKEAQTLRTCQNLPRAELESYCVIQWIFRSLKRTKLRINRLHSLPNPS